jgi:hypothetical protein
MGIGDRLIQVVHLAARLKQPVAEEKAKAGSRLAEQELLTLTRHAGTQFRMVVSVNGLLPLVAALPQEGLCPR